MKDQTSNKENAFGVVIIIISIILIGIICLILNHSRKLDESSRIYNNERFIVMDQYKCPDDKDINSITIIVDRETDVEYMLVYTYKGVSITPMMNPDGSLVTRE